MNTHINKYYSRLIIEQHSHVEYGGSSVGVAVE